VLGKLQQIKLTHYFNVIDSDDSASIEREDFVRFASRFTALRGVEAGTPEYEQFYADTLAWWDEIRKSADADYDGRVDLQEWLAFWSSETDKIAEAAGQNSNLALTQLRYRLSFTFDVADNDADEQISVEEYGHMLQAWGLDADVEPVFRRLDLNGDGVITRDEMVQLGKEFFLSNDPEAPGNYIVGDPFEAP